MLIKYYEVTADLKCIEKEVLSKMHNSSVVSLDVFQAEDNRNDLLVSVDIDDEIYIWNMGLDKTFSPDVMKFAAEQKPINVTNASWSKCGVYLAVSTVDSMYLYSQMNNEWVIYSSTNTEGVMQNYYEDS